eukprot:CAMPEP_0172509818 /NCGR_PEP_ID=MMETSP1066-20121228/223440_1 /TAXON_ID=671091 /ORGANISM="Coscinodiscus wailesii, Strain CCMP2513" /LENGTH=168 /DNA_ID=CAMNT_0013288493 /DNA_START=124 /DNA_END=627 /DNA_ORIENTATION=-
MATSLLLTLTPPIISSFSLKPIPIRSLQRIPQNTLTIFTKTTQKTPQRHPAPLNRITYPQQQHPLRPATTTSTSLSGYSPPQVNWYPGHIAKAEKLLSESLKSVDVVIEVRDARAPKATAHPRVGEWSAGRPRIVVLTKSDLVPRGSVASWLKSYETFGAGRWDGTVD